MFSKAHERRGRLPWVGWPVTLTPVFSEVMSELGSLQIPIWSPLAVISSLHVHVKGRSTGGGFWFREWLYFSTGFSVENTWNSCRRRKTDEEKLLDQKLDHWVWMVTALESIWNLKIVVVWLWRLLHNFHFHERHPKDYWIHFFLVLHKMYARKGVIGRLKITSSYEWMSWFWLASKNGRSRRRREGGESIPQVAPPPAKP